VGVRVALFSTYSAAIFALRMHIPKDDTGWNHRRNR